MSRKNNVYEVTGFDDPRIAMFTSLTDRQLRNRLHPDQGIVIVESPKVIATALEAGYEALALLCEEKHIDGDAAGIIDACPGLTVYTGPREVLEKITGYTLTRGVLCAMRRGAPPSVESVLAGAERVVVIDGVNDTTNIGSIFRSAAALNIDAVLLTSTSCDPLNRRSVRVSMGSVFLVPWTRINFPVERLRDYGFRTAAMALRKDSVDVDDPSLRAEPRLAIIMGTEGEGLDDDVIRAADYTVCIPMAHGVDSLNVGAAAAVAFWSLRKK